MASAEDCLSELKNIVRLKSMRRTGSPDSKRAGAARRR